MAIATYSPGIEFVQGSLAKPKKKDGHKCGDYLIGTHRTAETTNPECTRIYVRKADAYTRSTPPTQRELEQRTKFAQVAKAVADRRMDLSKVTQDQEAYLAQKEEPGGKKTFKSYLWMVCKAELENA